MKKILKIVFTLCLAASATAQEPAPKVLGVYYLTELPPSALVSLDGQSVYKIENTNDTTLHVQLLEIPKPQVSTSVYAVTGRVKYENVQSDGYLEMWSYFPPLHPGLPEGQYFSRTLGDSGAMGKITGTSDWRDFTLPFDPTSASGPPTRLEINLVLAGRGTVYLTPVKLVNYGASVSSSNTSAHHGWWSGRMAGAIGGTGGAIIGCFGGLIGCLAGMGKGRRFVLILTSILIVTGILLTIAGLVAVASRQPYAVWYPMLLLGIITTAVLGGNLPAIKKRYNDLEIRRMTSMDATGRS